MNCILQKRMWLAGASLLAIVLGSGDANAVVFGADYIIPTTGYYDFRVAGADGGGFRFGGAGAVVGGELFFEAGDGLSIVVGGGGGYSGSGAGGYAGSGGGGSFVFGGSGLLFAAGGGAGANFGTLSGSPGIGYGGQPGGPASYGGGGGSGIANPHSLPNPPPGTYAQAGSFPNGGAGACCYLGGVGASGGYGGGGGAGYNGGGGGGGAPGGGSDGGGFSFVIDTARNAFGITGGNGLGVPGGYGANGYVSINLVAVPEPSTWAMTLAGFAGLGWLARLRRRKLTPA